MADGTIICPQCGCIVGLELHRGAACGGLGDALASWLLRFAAVRGLYLRHFGGRMRAFLLAPPRRSFPGGLLRPKRIPITE